MQEGRVVAYSSQ
jgi:hypothetical protein